jgi:predicted RNA binding protein YcfA (HicA-like mRNA interferase family)
MIIPAVTARQLQKVLSQLDWQLANEYGDCRYYVSDEFPGKLITLPLYDEKTLPLKVLVHILDAADLNFADLVWFI